MNNTETPFTTEFFDKEAKRRKQIPIAVFSIVAAHVVLFAGLLGAAGCRKDPAASAGTEGENPAKKFAAAEYQNQASASETTSLPNASASIASQTSGHEQPIQYGPLENVMISETEEPVKLTTAKPTASAPSGKKAILTSTKATPVVSAPSNLPLENDTYIVKSGDSLDKIARRYGTTTKAIKSSNNLKSDLIRVGQKLKISNNKGRQA